MPYQELNHRRIPYDIDGTVVGYNIGQDYAKGITDWLSESQLSAINDEGTSTLWKSNEGSYGGSVQRCMWFFFPEAREIEASNWLGSWVRSLLRFEMQGSNDTTNGMDGTWETAVFPSGTPMGSHTVPSWWRIYVKPVSFSTTYKTIRIKFELYSSYDGDSYFRKAHFYGRKAYGQTPDDILICNADGNEKTALLDWGDRPEGTTMIKSFKLKNVSSNRIASGVNIQLNHGDFGLSFSEDGPWTATLDIASIAPDNLSATIYIRNLLGAPPLILGPKAGRCIITVGSWT